MAGSLNRVTLIGNVGQDPDIRSFPNGGRVANFSLATSERWKDKQTGEQKERTEWHRVAVKSDGLVGVIERFVSKGSKLYVEGSLQTRKWADQSGQEKYTTEVVVSGFGGSIILLDRAGGTTDNVTDIHNKGFAPGGPQTKETYKDLDEVPF